MFQLFEHSDLTFPVISLDHDVCGLASPSLVFHYFCDDVAGIQALMPSYENAGRHCLCDTLSPLDVITHQTVESVSAYSCGTLDDGYVNFCILPETLPARLEHFVCTY